MTYFSKLSLESWRQFKSVDLDFSRRVSILTGRNGTGKTSVLNILAKHASHQLSFLGSPVQKRDEYGRFTSGYWGDAELRSEKYDTIGRIDYDDGQSTNITVPKDGAKSFGIKFTNPCQLDVLNLSSHRRVPAYKEVEQIPTQPMSSERALERYQTEHWTTLTGGVSRNPPLLRMKEALISMAAFGPGNEHVRPNREAFGVFQDFENRLRIILPDTIGFDRLVVDIPDVILETSSGNFLIDASSGGLMSLIDLTWEITLFSQGKERFVVLLDEPENHLHPSMQREFLPSLVGAFPTAQFIVATHSPFVVSSVKDARIYVFDVEMGAGQYSSPIDYSASQNVVVSLEIDPRDRKASSNILREVLGVPVSMPIWAEEELDQIVTEFSEVDFGAAQLRALKAKLDQSGLGDFLPDVVMKLSSN
jgi:energy-coupling factor transporter ATP-binding protein EcfA2